MKCFLFLVFFLLIFADNSFAQKEDKVNYEKDIVPLINAQKYDDALPLLKTCYNQSLKKYKQITMFGIDEDNVIDQKRANNQMNNYNSSSENIAMIYYNKAIKDNSTVFADSAIVWFNIMKMNNHPKENSISSYIDKMNDIKEQAAELLLKKQEEERKEKERSAMAEIVNELVYFRFVEECIAFEHIYYELKIYDSQKANKMYIEAKQQLPTIVLDNLPINLDLTDVPTAVESPGTYSSSLYNYFGNRKKSLKYHSVSYKRDGKLILEVSFISHLDNQQHYYSSVPLEISDSSLINIECTEKIQQLNINNNKTLSSLLEIARKQQYAINAKKEREERLANNAANEKIMLDDKTLPYATTKLCDYRDGKFVAYFENNTVYRRHYNGGWEAVGSKVLIRNGKKIFYRQKHYNEAVIESDGSVRIYTVSESTGERLSDHYYNYGYVNGNRFDSEADSKEDAAGGFLFKGSAMEAIIIVSLCNSFK